MKLQAAQEIVLETQSSQSLITKLMKWNPEKTLKENGKELFSTNKTPQGSAAYFAAKHKLKYKYAKRPLNPDKVYAVKKLHQDGMTLVRLGLLFNLTTERIKLMVEETKKSHD